MSEYECALSGEVGDDEMGEMPLGWTTITLERKLPNPEWMEIQQAKAALVEATLAQMPEEAREIMRPLVAIQIRAQFAALEADTDEFEMTTEVVHISSPERDAQVMSAYNEIRERLGLAELEMPSDEGEE